MRAPFAVLVLLPALVCFASLFAQRAAAARPSLRIAYGEYADRGQFPYSVYFKNDREFCSGSLIARRVVLTAAHCVVGRDGNLASLAKWNATISYGSTLKRHSKQIPIKAVYKPDTYKHHLPYADDIALIELTNPVPSSIKLSKLPISQTKPTLSPGVKLAAIGWGATQNGEYTNRLKYAPGLTVLSQSECAKVFKAGLGVSLPSGKFCVEINPNTKASTCAGDSGGPYIDANGVQLGVNSVSITSVPGVLDACGSPKAKYKAPTRVASYLKWINQTMISNNMLD